MRTNGWLLDTLWWVFVSLLLFYSCVLFSSGQFVISEWNIHHTLKLFFNHNIRIFAFFLAPLSLSLYIDISRVEWKTCVLFNFKFKSQIWQITKHSPNLFDSIVVFLFFLLSFLNFKLIKCIKIGRWQRARNKKSNNPHSEITLYWLRSRFNSGRKWPCNGFYATPSIFLIELKPAKSMLSVYRVGSFFSPLSFNP